MYLRKVGLAPEVYLRRNLEAAIGSVDQRQLETLMAHGLTPEQAVEMVVAGLLR
jgi:hypothetical protein